MKFRLVTLNDIINTSEGVLRRALGPQIALVKNLGVEPWLIQVDPSQIEQVITRLTLFSRQTMPKGGRITFTTANITMTPDILLEAKPGSYVELTIADNGYGTHPNLVDKMFDPYFSSADLTGSLDANGVLLTSVYGIVTQSNGHIKVYSDIGKGTTFKIWFPKVS